jgi:hypothetical protein
MRVYGVSVWRKCMERCMSTIGSLTTHTDTLIHLFTKGCRIRNTKLGPLRTLGSRRIGDAGEGGADGASELTVGCEETP